MLNIIYQDNHLFCLDKPGALLTQPSGSDKDSLEGQAKAWIKEQFNKPGAVFLEAAHRLDAPACGVVMFARTSKALSRLNASIRAGECHKEYRALVEGDMPKKNGTLKNWLKHDDHFARIVNSPEGALECTLSYEVLDKFDGLSLLKIILGSGRYHQIRAQLSHLGHPIVGDARYGSHVSFVPGAIALQHYCLKLKHPVTKEDMEFISRFDLRSRHVV